MQTWCLTTAVALLPYDTCRPCEGSLKRKAMFVFQVKPLPGDSGFTLFDHCKKSLPVKSLRSKNERMRLHCIYPASALHLHCGVSVNTSFKLLFLHNKFVFCICIGKCKIIKV